jgi:hypothetical protein
MDINGLYFHELLKSVVPIGPPGLKFCPMPIPVINDINGKMMEDDCKHLPWINIRRF